MSGYDKTQLQAIFRAAVDKAGQDVRDFEWEDREKYAGWVAQQFRLVQHTTRYLCLTAGAFGPDDDEWHRNTLTHLREETGHDALAMRDLKALGATLQSVPELPQTAAIYQSQYYWIAQRGPVSHLGYALLLEGLAAIEGPELVKRIEGTHGRGTASFLRTHVHDDVDHFDGGILRLAECPQQDIARALQNLEQSAVLYSMMLTAVGEWARKKARGNLRIAG